MPQHRYDSWESYFYPETMQERNGTLRNLFHAREGGYLAAIEQTAGIMRERELVDGDVTIPQTFDASHLRAIHRHLFQDVYEWAGEYRTVDLAKGKGDFAHVGDGTIDRHLVDASRSIRSTPWATLDLQGFAEATAAAYAHVNQAHPFREGNGRAAKVFLRDVAAQSPWTLDYTRVTPEAWNARADASRPNMPYYLPDPEPMVDVFAALAVPRTQPVPTSALEAAAIARTGSAPARDAISRPSAPTARQAPRDADYGSGLER